jgi:hypothetical protein
MHHEEDLLVPRNGNHAAHDAVMGQDNDFAGDAAEGRLDAAVDE